MADSKRRGIMGESSVAVVPMYNFIDNLQDNLLIEILHRLPCQSAVQGKLVCKRWCALISNPYFVRRFIHYHHSRFDSSSLPLTLFIQYTEVRFNELGRIFKYVNKLTATSTNPELNPRRLCLDFIPFLQEQEQEPEPIFVVASFNDLLVCCKGTSFRWGYDICNPLIICNPLTKQWRALPPLPLWDAWGWDARIKVGFVCQPSYSYCDCGKQNLCLCIINAHYRYKLVCIPQYWNHPNIFNVNVFCSETGEWSESVVLSTQPPSSIIIAAWAESPRTPSFPISDIVAYKGLLHWRIETTIYVLDPFKDINHCRLINPPVLEEIHCLGVCRGRLRICELNHFDQCLSVWDLEDYRTEKWCLEHKICLPEIFPENFQLRTFWVLAFHPHDGDIVYLNLYCGLVLCNLQRKSLELVNDSDLQESLNQYRNIYWSSVFPFVHPWWPTSIPPLRPNALFRSHSV